MQAFIVRPFGTKKDIDFDRVEASLISPALDRLGITGRTTGEIVKQGNIRTDMFVKLLTADLVVADVSIHNANVFYELGIRHALRDRRSFLLKSQGDEVPFDIMTDRYFLYEADKPEQHLDDLVEALRATIDSVDRDSPVFQLLPKLEPADPAQLNLVPFDFREEVERTAKRNARGVLRLLADEVKEFDWAIEGMRVIGRAQFDIGDTLGAKETWEAVQVEQPLDVEANEVLGTVYERLGNLNRSDQVLRRILKEGNLSATQQSRTRALLGRNGKTRWMLDWKDIEEPEAAREAALRSPHLETSVEGYERGFREDRNDSYAGLNALTQVVILTDLATELPAVWRERFEAEEDAARHLNDLLDLRRELEVGVKLTVDSDLHRAAFEDDPGGWAEISEARLTHLLSSNPKRVAHLYTRALASAPDYARESTKAQLEQFVKLGIRAENAIAAMEAIDKLKLSEQGSSESGRVILFAGHRVDDADRQTRRFPSEAEDLARELIAAAVTKEQREAEGNLSGIAGGASGSDILFHEVCAEMGIETKLYLALPPMEFSRECVQSSGPEWVERFNRLCERMEPQVLSESVGLPRWLRAKKDYDVFLRSTYWMIHRALSMGRSYTLIALWDGAEPEGPGGTYDIIREARQRGVKFVHLDAGQLTAGTSAVGIGRRKDGRPIASDH